MKWLVTYNKQVGRENVLKKLQSLGCEVESNRAIPMGDEEEMLTVEGPRGLDQLARQRAAMLRIFPDSTMSSY